MTTRTSSLVSATAFADELVKIAAASLPSEKKGKLKSWLRDSGIIAAGTGLGTGAYMLGERGLGPMLGPRWNTLKPATRASVAGAASMAATVGGLLLAHKLMREKHKDE